MKIKLINLLLYKDIHIPRPHVFADLPLKSMAAPVELSEITLKINELLPQLSDFISQFHNIILTNNINVITDGGGNMSDTDAEKFSRRISIIDRLITTRGQEINDLLQKGLEIEGKLKKENVNYTSQILDKVNEFNRLNASYKH